MLMTVPQTAMEIVTAVEQKLHMHVIVGLRYYECNMFAVIAVPKPSFCRLFT